MSHPIAALILLLIFPISFIGMKWNLERTFPIPEGSLKTVSFIFWWMISGFSNIIWAILPVGVILYFANETASLESPTGTLPMFIGGLFVFAIYAFYIVYPFVLQGQVSK